MKIVKLPLGGFLNLDLVTVVTITNEVVYLAFAGAAEDVPFYDVDGEYLKSVFEGLVGEI